MVAQQVDHEAHRWVVLVYRMPREPSTPRIAVWRRLRDLGVAQLADGVVGLPASPQHQEHLEWVAERVDQAGGHAVVWRASPTTILDERALVDELRAARATEYDELLDEICAAEAPIDHRTLARWRRELRRIERRDYFDAPGRTSVRAALDDVGRVPEMSP